MIWLVEYNFELQDLFSTKWQNLALIKQKAFADEKNLIFLKW